MIPQIQIQQTFGQIGIRYQPQVWQIHSQQADLSIQAPQAQIDIQTIPDQLAIDQTQAFADEGLRTPLAFTENQAQQAHQIAVQGIADRADWGHRFLHTEKGNPLSQWVMRYREKTPQVAPALVPSPFSVKVHVQLGEVHISADVQPVRIEATPHAPVVEYEAGAATAYVAQSPSVQIIAPSVGQLVDTRV